MAEFGSADGPITYDWLLADHLIGPGEQGTMVDRLLDRLVDRRSGFDDDEIAASSFWQDAHDDGDISESGPRAAFVGGGQQEGGAAGRDIALKNNEDWQADWWRDDSLFAPIASGFSDHRDGQEQRRSRTERGSLFGSVNDDQILPAILRDEDSAAMGGADVVMIADGDHTDPVKRDFNLTLQNSETNPVIAADLDQSTERPGRRSSIDRLLTIASSESVLPHADHRAAPTIGERAMPQGRGLASIASTNAGQAEPISAVPADKPLQGREILHVFVVNGRDLAHGVGAHLASGLDVPASGVTGIDPLISPFAALGGLA